MGNGGKHNKEYTPARRASETNFDNTATTLTSTIASSFGSTHDVTEVTLTIQSAHDIFYDSDDDITMRDEKENRRKNESTIPDATTPPAEGSKAPDPAHQIVTSRASELSTPPTTCPYTASSSTSTLTTSSPPMRPSHPTYIDTYMKPNQDKPGIVDGSNHPLLTEISEGSDTEGDDAVDSKYNVQTPLLTHTTFPYIYEKTITVTSPASEKFFYTNTSSLCTITCDPTHSKSQIKHNPKPSQQILGSSSFNQYHDTQNPEVLRRTRGKCYGQICPDASVTYDPTNINLKQSLAQKRFPIRQQTIFIMNHFLRSTLTPNRKPHTIQNPTNNNSYLLSTANITII